MCDPADIVSRAIIESVLRDHKTPEEFEAETAKFEAILTGIENDFVVPRLAEQLGLECRHVIYGLARLRERGLISETPLDPKGEADAIALIAEGHLLEPLDVRAATSPRH